MSEERPFIASRRAVTAGIGTALVAALGGATVAVAKAKAGPTPDERIEAAIAEIQAAMLEKHPGWRVQVTNDHQQAMATTGVRAPYSHAVLIYSSSEVFGPEEARWFRHLHGGTHGR